MKKILFLSLLIAHFGVFAQNGIELVYQSKVFEDRGELVKRQRIATIWITPNKLKISSNNDKDAILIFDKKEELIQLINRLEGSYLEMTEKDLKEINNQISQAKEQMDKQLASLPPEQREMMKKQMGNMFSSNEKDKNKEYRDTEISKVIGPYNTSLHEAWSINEKVEEVYIVDFDMIEFSKNQFEVIEGLMGFIRENMNVLFQNFSNEVGAVIQPEDHPSFQEGLPVQTINYESGIKKSEEILKSIKHIEIPEEAFAVPPGYKKKDLMSELKPQGR